MALEESQKELLTKLHRLLYSLGAAAYVLATLATLPFWDRSTALVAYAFFLKTSSLLAITASFALLRSLCTLWQGLLFSVGLIGQGLYFWSASIYVGEFNKGKFYILGSFLVSLAVELRILALILNNVSFEVIRRQKRILAQLGLETFGSILFLIGTGIFQARSPSILLAAFFNVAGGASLAIAAALLRENNSSKRKVEADEAELEIFQIPSDK